ncbi:MAG: cytochrome ubiquinol oxidase subunit I, partial [Planctomycetes bacterium]|nr:cytochrome ubiquinol oxidase subunit I [Planctomycetota bacterium]
QPWVIQGVMRTADAVTPAPGVPSMFFAFTLLYALLGVTVLALLRRIAATQFSDASSF